MNRADGRWRDRFLMPRLGFPGWAADAPGRLCATSNASGTWQLHTSDARRGENWQQVSDGPAGTVRGLLTPDGDAVVWFADAGDGTGHYVRAPFRGGPAEPLLPAASPCWPRGVAVTRHGVVVAFAPARPALGTAGEAPALLRVTADGPRPLERADRPTALVLASPDGRLLALRRPGTRHGVAHVLDVVDAFTGAVVRRLSGCAPLRPTAFSPDSRRLLLREEGDDTRDVVLELLSGWQEAVPQPGPGEAMAWLPAGGSGAGKILRRRQDRGRSGLDEVDLSTGEVVTLMEATGTVHDAAVRPGGSVWASVSSAAHPRRTASLGYEPVPASLGTQPGAGTSRPAGAPYRRLRTLPGFLATPARTTGPDGPAPLPLVVLVHGGPHQHAEDTHDPEVQAWVDRGFAVAVPNYRGSTGHGHTYLRAADDDPGHAEVADLVTCVQALVTDGVADAARVALVGSSWGGYLALLAAGARPDLARAVVATSAVADLVGAYRAAPPALRRADEERFGGGPDEVPARWRRASPLTWADAVRCAVLVVAGDADRLCPLGQLVRYVDAVRAARPDGEVDLAVDDTGHQVRVDQLAVRRQERSMSFVERALARGGAR